MHSADEISTVMDIHLTSLEEPMFTRMRSCASRNTRSMRPLGVAAFCAALVAVTPAAAQAQTVTDPDTVGDVITFNEDDAAVPVPERTLNDVSATTLTHSARRVAIRLQYVDLSKRADDYQGLFIAVVTDEGVRRRVSLDAWRGHWSGETQMYGGNYRDVPCAVRHDSDYEANTMKVSFPRRCASNPRWVKFRAVAYAQGEDGYFADDALRNRPIDSQSGHLKSSGRIHREAAS
jgi:hypothetical protein